MLTLKDLKNDVNITKYNITKDEIKLERYGYCRYIIDLSKSIKIPSEVSSLAMLYMHNFFNKKMFINYDKRLVSCAALLLACKVEDIQGKIADIVRAHLSKESSFYDKNKVITGEEIKETINKVTTLEMSLLKQLEFKVKFNLPIDYIYIYSGILFPINETEINSIGIKIEADSFFTLANNIFHSHVVALSCIVIACQLLEIPSFLENNSFDFSNLRNYYLKILNSNSGNSAYYNRDRDKNSIYLNPSEVVSLEYFNIKLLEMEFLVGDDVKLGNKYDDTWYDSLPWYKKLHPFVEEFEILTAVNFIVEFYIDIKKFNFS